MKRWHWVIITVAVVVVVYYAAVRGTAWDPIRKLGILLFPPPPPGAMRSTRGGATRVALGL